jgi:hypothetical protein
MITKHITDMSIYGITGKDQWDATVRTTTKTSISQHGKYFPTRKEAEAWLKEQTK